jgi:uncharacterized protein YcbX
VSAKVAWIAVAPVKALALVQRDEVVVEPWGVGENRRFHLVDADGRMMNGKTIGPLVQVVPDWDEATGALALSFPDGSVVEDTVRLGDRIETDFFGRPVPGRVVQGPWAAALSELGGRELTLVQAERPGDGVDRSPRSGAVTLLGLGSLEVLAREAGVDGPVDGRRFRMTFGLEGLEAHAEDDWLGRDVRIGEAVVRPRGNVGRCAVTTQNPETGVPDLDTLRVLKAYRDAVPTTEPLPFGVHAEVVRPGRVRLGNAAGPV